MKAQSRKEPLCCNCARSSALTGVTVESTSLAAAWLTSIEFSTREIAAHPGIEWGFGIIPLPAPEPGILSVPGMAYLVHHVTGTRPTRRERSAAGRVRAGPGMRERAAGPLRIHATRTGATARPIASRPGRVTWLSTVTCHQGHQLSAQGFRASRLPRPGRNSRTCASRGTSRAWSRRRPRSEDPADGRGC